MDFYRLPDGGFVLQSSARQLPGVYAAESAHWYAFRFPDRKLLELRDRVNVREHRHITVDDLKAEYHDRWQ